VDRNYPAAASGRPVIRLGEVTVTRAIEAILSVMPLDSFVDKPLERMEVDQDPGITTPMQARLECAHRDRDLWRGRFKDRNLMHRAP